jgi:hypothetical protein
LNGIQIIGPDDCRSRGGDDWKKGGDWDDDDWDRNDHREVFERPGSGRLLRRPLKRRSTEGSSSDGELNVRFNTLRIELRKARHPFNCPDHRQRRRRHDTADDHGRPSPAANGAGWNRSDVQVGFTCSDAGSGIASCPPSRLVSTEGQGQIVSGTATDKSGNTATAQVTLNIDKTAPTIVASVTPAPNAAGWVTQNATVTFVCADGRSGIASCPPPTVVSSDGANPIVQGTATEGGEHAHHVGDGECRPHCADGDRVGRSSAKYPGMEQHQRRRDVQLRRSRFGHHDLPAAGCGRCRRTQPALLRHRHR